MPTVAYFPDAVEDLRNIWAYVAEQSQSYETADRLIEAIHQSATLFAGQPEMGDPRFEMADHLRSFHAGRYVVF